jgi:hypothetical protein
MSDAHPRSSPGSDRLPVGPSYDRPGPLQAVPIITIVLRSVVRHARIQSVRGHWPGTEDGFIALCRLSGLPAPDSPTHARSDPTRGVGLATAVILDATIIRVVLAPAVMSLLGHHAWWPTRQPTPEPAPEPELLTPAR